jgi:hypothetical protein
MVRCKYICRPYPSHGQKLCLVPVVIGAGMAQINILLHDLTGKIDVMGCLAQMCRHDILVWPSATLNLQE